jgi:hypothetical protein
MRITRVLVVFALVLTPSVAAAQPSAPPRPADAERVTDAELTLAQQLVELMDVQGAAVQGVRVMLNAQVAANPQLREYRGILEDWASDIFSGEEAGQAFARLYAETFTESELRDLIAFYESPTGRRVTSEQIHVTTRAEEIGRELAEAHSADLMIRLQAAMEEPD